MKKCIYLCAAVLLVTGCSSVATRNGRESLLYQKPRKISVRPLQAEIKVGQAINGVAECEKWFWFWTKQPAKQTYGTALQVAEGNFSEGPCTRGAVYDALVKNNAELIVAPRYTAVQKGNWCLFGWCVHRVNKIIVTGYKGNVVNFQTVEEEKLQHEGDSPDSSSKKGFWIFGKK